MGKRRKKYLWMLALTAALTTAASAGFYDSVTVRNRISSGDVKIELKEYQRNQKGEMITYVNEKSILPGDVISKIPEIENCGSDCWIRARIQFGNTNEKIAGISDENLSGISTMWKKIGEYYYYMRILKKGEKIRIFDEVHIPESWTEEHTSQKLTLAIEADAMQAANFAPNFDAMSPWGDVPIEKCIHEKDGTVLTEREKVELSVKLEGETGKLLAVPDDFFTNFNEILPGDLLEDRIVLKNTTDKTVELMFRTETEKLSEEEKDFLQNLGFQLLYKGAVIYSGTLYAEDLREEISLGTFHEGEGGELIFQIDMPKQLKNEYAKRIAAVNWIFSVKGLENPEEDSPLGGTGTESVKTGDNTRWEIYLYLMLIFGSIGAVVIYVKKEEKENEK